jgi:hypothetical protein
MGGMGLMRWFGTSWAFRRLPVLLAPVLLAIVPVIPAQAGIFGFGGWVQEDSGLRGNDGVFAQV